MKTITATVNRHRRDYSGSYVVASKRFENVDEAKAYIIEKMKTRFLVYGIIEGTDVDGNDVHGMTETDGPFEDYS